MQIIEFFSEEVEFTLPHPEAVKKWIISTIESKDRELEEVNIIFCSDSFLLNINREYLEHDYYTDIITFDYSEESLINGELYISVDTVKSNSEIYGVSFIHEMKRVIIHGILHLIGFKDATDEERDEMRGLEDYYLGKYEE